MKFANCWSEKYTGRDVFSGGIKKSYGGWQSHDSGNMNLTGGRCGNRDEEIIEIEEEFSVI